MFFQRRDSLRPAEAHAAERLHSLDVVFHRRRRVLYNLLLCELWHGRGVLLLFLPAERQADLSSPTSVGTETINY